MSLPVSSIVEQAAKLHVLNSDGKEVLFGSLIEDKGALVVFIHDLPIHRIPKINSGHFFCGNCQLYVTQLASVRPEALEKANKRLVVIGCGDYQPIKSYTERTNFKSPIFADPSRALFQIFGLTESLETTPKGEQKKSYITKSYLSNLLGSIRQGPLKNPQHIGKQGNFSQLGGEFIFGPNNQCTFAYRMKHTEDHVEVADLMREAGVEYP